MSKISEKSAGVQLATIVTIVGLVTGGMGSLVLWAADAKIDEKYATDADLLAVQEVVQAQVETITTSVTENTTTVRATASSVDGLTLVVLGLQVDDLESEIVALEAEKRSEGAGWNERDENDLRNKQRALDDLMAQRQILLQRILAAGNP